MIYPVRYDKGKYRSFGWTNGKVYHTGHDFNVDIDTPVCSIMKGRVIFASHQVSGYGGYKKKGGVLWILHCTGMGDAIIAQYGHVKIFKKVDEIVKEGEPIGTITGYVCSDNIDRPHLHFSIYDGLTFPDTKWGYVDNLDNWIDPMRFLRIGGAVWKK